METREPNKGVQILQSCLARMGRGVLLVMSGPSGAGKGTLSRRLLSELPQLTLSISATTRTPREGEREGIHYYFLSKPDFERQIEENRFLEFAQVYDNYYGTPLGPVQASLTSGKDVLLEIDIQGALQVKERYPEAALIFIAPPSLEELARRIYGRGTDSREVIEKRLSLASQELEFINHYDYCVINDDVEQALARLRAIVEAEKTRIYRKLD